MVSPDDYQRFADLGYNDFRKMATDPELSNYQKIGFPDSYRKGYEEAIFADIRQKLSGLDGRQKTVLDVGPGCSELPRMLIDHCRHLDHTLLLVDSPEMLAQLPDDGCVHKFPAYYPDCPDLFSRYTGGVDVLLCYSVFHYVFSESCSWRFLDRSLSLLAPGGQMLIGDIPNVSKRKRFFSSSTGKKFHRAFTGDDVDPEVLFNVIEPDKIDDAVVAALLQRARTAGFDAYVLPQGAGLPMSNRREDVLITRP